MGPELVATTVVAARPAAVSGEAARTLQRARCAQLRRRYPFASEVLTLFEALLDVWSTPACSGRIYSTVSQASLATHAAESVMPLVIDATLAHGPQALATAVSERFVNANLVEIATRWLSDDELLPIDRYLARASLQPLLENLCSAGALAPAFDREPVADDLHCPRCAARPQLAFFELSGEALVSGPRRLLCARCSHAWIAQRLTCASCGEQAGAQLPVFREKETFPHIRVDACESCRRYVLTIDLKKDPLAVPLVDELAALPLDLYAQERGYTKIVPNLMGN